MNRAKGRSGLGHHRFDGLGVGDVTRNVLNRVWKVGHQLLHVFARAGADIDDRALGASGGESTRDGGANATPCAG